MKTQFKKFQTLSIEELYAVLKLRTDVFVVEQDCPYPELDNKDQVAVHAMGMNGNQLGAYSRIFGPGDYFDDHAAIGRIATHEHHRGHGLGRLIILHSISFIKSIYGENTSIKIAAQSHLENFYASLDFKKSSEEFLEDGIPHIFMIHP